MKILALVTDAFGAPGGIACYNRDLMVALAGAAPVETVRVLPRHGEAVVIDSRLRQLKGQPARLRYSVAAFLEARRMRPDRIFCGHLFMLPLAALIGRLTGVPVWLQIYGIEAWTPASRAIVRALGGVDFVTCISRYTRQRFLAWSDMDPVKVRILPTTVSDRYAPGDRAACRALWNLGDRPVLLTVGRLASAERYKGHDRVLACLPALLAAHPSLLYLISGEGDDRTRLERLADELGVADSVHFLGAVAIDRLPQLFNAADLFVMPSTGEGFGIVYLEAMACGTPALGLDQDGSRDPLRDGEMGIVTSEAELASAIAQALAIERESGLSAHVQDVFGQSSFSRQVGVLLQQLVRADGVAKCAE